MMLPITRYQLCSAIEKFDFTPKKADRIVWALEQMGRLESSGSMIKITNPTAPDSEYIRGLVEGTRGTGPGGRSSSYKVKEYLLHIDRESDRLAAVK